MAPARQRGVSGVSLREFFSQVLRQLGAPVTQNNLNKLGAIAQLEGHGGDYNPFNYIVGPGTNFNSVGVKNYPDVQTGIAQTVKLLNQGNTRKMRDSLMSNGSYQGWLQASSGFYNSWGGPSVRTAEHLAERKLNEQIDGPRVTNWSGVGSAAAAGAASLQQGGGNSVADLQAVHRWMLDEEGAFHQYLGRLTPDEQLWITNEVRTPRDQADFFRWYAQTSPEVQRFVNYLGNLPLDARHQAVYDRLDARGQGGSTPGGPGPQSTLPPAPQRPSADPAMSAELQQLLGRFGVSYPNAPAPTPSLLAFLRGIGSSLSTAEDLRRRATEQINQRAATAGGDLERSAGRAKQGITTDLLRRGVLGSGEANTRFARHEEDLGAARSGIEQERVSGVTQADFAYQQSADSARQQALERTIGVEQQQNSDFGAAQANYDAMVAQQKAADLAWERERHAMEESYRRQEELMRRYAQSGVVI